MIRACNDDDIPHTVTANNGAFKSKVLDSGEFPRAMTWQFAKCPDTGKIVYEFQTGANDCRCSGDGPCSRRLRMCAGV